MDSLSGLLVGPTARGAFVLRMVMAPPWAVRVQDRAALTVAAVISGEVWVTAGAEEPRRLPPGHLALLRGPDPYVFGDHPDTPASIVVHPGQRCEDLQGRSLEAPLLQGVRTWGNDPEGGTAVLVGTYEQVGATGRGLLAHLPPLVVVDGADLGPPVVEVLAAEIGRDVPGQQVVLDRLLDLVTVTALRAVLDRAGAEAPPWWRAAADPVVGPALRLLHHNPDHRWTVATLAHQAGVSRAALARRFTELVGQPPMRYLTAWRLALAADLLVEPGATVHQVASRVGYGSSFAFSTAFTRAHGISPSAHRARATAPAAPSGTGGSGP